MKGEWASWPLGQMSRHGHGPDMSKGMRPFLFAVLWGEGIPTSCMGFLGLIDRKVIVNMHLLGLISQGHSNGVISLRRCCCAKGFGKLQCNLLIYQTTV